MRSSWSAILLLAAAPSYVGAWAPLPLATSQASQVQSPGVVADPPGNAVSTSGRLRGAAEQEAGTEPLAAWTRSLLAGLAAFAVVAATTSSAARAQGTSVNVFFGQGCFWHVQHEFVKKETSDLGRSGADITALSGYAGGTKAGDGNRVCYHNLAMAPDYGNLGHTEVVNVSLPEEKIRDFAKEYFDAAAGYRFGRADPQDRGSEYRSAVGIPGGMDGPLFKEIEAANNGRMQLLPGKGNDPDTVGTKKVYIYDSDKFPFYQGEVYHQFHDDMLERYSDGYHKLKKVLLDGGKITKVACPEVGF